MKILNDLGKVDNTEEGRLANFDSSKAVLSLLLLLCEQMKDLRIAVVKSNNLPEMNQIVTNAKKQNTKMTTLKNT